MPGTNFPMPAALTNTPFPTPNRALAHPSTADAALPPARSAELFPAAVSDCGQRAGGGGEPAAGRLDRDVRRDDGAAVLRAAAARRDA